MVDDLCGGRDIPAMKTYELGKTPQRDAGAPNLFGAKGLMGRQGTGATCWDSLWAVGGENMARIWGRGIEEDQTSEVKDEK